MTGWEYLILAPISAVVSALMTMLARHVFPGPAGSKQVRRDFSDVTEIATPAVGAPGPVGAPHDKVPVLTAHLQQSTALLPRYDLHWLREAKRTSIASLVSSIIVGPLVVTILFIEFSRGRVDHEYVTLVGVATAMASVVTVLFQRQSKLAHTHLARQSDAIRAQLIHESQRRYAFDMVSCISDPKVRDALITSLLGFHGEPADEDPAPSA